MWDLCQVTLLTNNERAFEKYKNQLEVILLPTYRDVLIRARDLVYDQHVLLTHPQASSLKPNQTPYRSILVYPKGTEDNTKDILLIEQCIQVFDEWQAIAPTPAQYEEQVDNDFQTIDLSIIDNVMPRMD